jgi:DNA-binding XRE family transcriptional regulator
MLRSRGRPVEQAPPGFFTASEAAKKLGVSSGTIHNRIKTGTLDGNVGTLPSGERRYYARKSAVEKYLTGNGASRLPWMDQGPDVEELASRLDVIAGRQDVIADRQEDIERLQESIESRLQNIEKWQESINDAVREVLATLQQHEQAAERERDELRELFTNAAYQATPPPLDTPAEDTNVEVTNAQNNDRTESPETRKNQHRRRRRRINGRKVRLLREDAYLTQEKLAKKAGLNHVTISAIERGLRPSPRNRTYSVLAEAFGIDPLELEIRD